MHDPMAMRPFMGYNFGKYLQHWIDLNKEGRKVRYLLEDESSMLEQHRTFSADL